jgi:hypothetical protein
MPVQGATGLPVSRAASEIETLVMVQTGSLRQSATVARRKTDWLHTARVFPQTRENPAIEAKADFLTVERPEQFFPSSFFLNLPRRIAYVRPGNRKCGTI